VDNWLLKPAWQGTGLVMERVNEMLRRIYPDALWGMRATEREIALTFDDGPHQRDTLPLLEVLARHDVAATFFNIGSRVAARPDLTRAVYEAGHQVASHGYHHRHFPLIPPDRLIAQLKDAREAVARACDCDPALLNYVRPPYGTITTATLKLLTAAAYRPVMWSVVPLHWQQPLQPTIDNVMAHMRPGGVLVLHESLGGPPITTIVDEILRRLLADGYRFITIDEMWRREMADVCQGL
jgi:peptidoglycan/xylan/chitin deacetylase (PgdA/CDA1 family)